MTRYWPTILIVVMLTATWGSLQGLSRGESPPTKKPFSAFPQTIEGRWQGREVGLSADVLDVLKLSDYMMRVYVPTTSARDTATAAPLWLYVGYYASQRTGATYHSPKNCLPGAGWQFLSAEHVQVSVPGWAPVAVNHVVIEKGTEKQVILYWYQDRGRVIASEYAAKLYLVWDAMTRNRSDGSLVRISVPVVTSTDQAAETAYAFLRDAWPMLHEYLPSDLDDTIPVS